MSPAGKGAPWDSPGEEMLPAHTRSVQNPHLPCALREHGRGAGAVPVSPRQPRERWERPADPRRLLTRSCLTCGEGACGCSDDKGVIQGSPDIPTLFWERTAHDSSRAGTAHTATPGHGRAAPRRAPSEEKPTRGSFNPPGAAVEPGPAARGSAFTPVLAHPPGQGLHGSFSTS